MSMGTPCGSNNLEVDEQPLQGSVGVVDNQVKVELLDEQKFVLQDLLQNPLLSCWALLNEIAHKLGAGHVELINFTGQVCTRQPKKMEWTEWTEEARRQQKTHAFTFIFF